jgi:hypothetical protein
MAASAAHTGRGGLRTRRVVVDLAEGRFGGSRRVRRLLEVVVRVSRRVQTVEGQEAGRRSPGEVVGAVRRAGMGSGLGEDMASVRVVVPGCIHCIRSHPGEEEELPTDPEEVVL